MHPLFKGILIVFYIHFLVLLFVWLGWAVGLMGILSVPFVAYLVYATAERMYEESHKDDGDDPEPYDMKNPDLWP